MIEFDKVSFEYESGAPVIKDLSFRIEDGESVGLIGANGAGKSTIMKLLLGLVQGEGKILVDDIEVNKDNLGKIRKKLGFVFQFPEQQLFAKNVYEDVVFGPRNTGVTEVEAEKRAYEAIEVVGLSDEIYDIPINKLSGGEKRRVALAGVLAMQPEYLILDEPLSGLDPEGKQNMLDIIDALHKDAGITIVMVSHDVESAAGYADRLIALSGGEVIADGVPANVFYEMYLKAEDREKEIYNLPVIMQLLISLRNEGLEVSCLVKDIDEGIDNILKGLK